MHANALSTASLPLTQDQPRTLMESIQVLRQTAEEWLKQERIQKAIEHYQLALALIAQNPSPDLWETEAELCHATGQLEFDLGHRREAGAFYKRALTLYIQLYPHETHQDVANSYFIMGRFFEQIWKIDLARTHYQKALSITQTVQGEFHPHVQAIRAQIERFEKNVSPIISEK